MRIATNQPFRLALTRHCVDLTFLGNDSDAIVLVCSNILGDSCIPEIEKILHYVKATKKRLSF